MYIIYYLYSLFICIVLFKYIYTYIYIYKQTFVLMLNFPKCFRQNQISPFPVP